MPDIHILHISDLHRAAEREDDQKIVLDAFLTDLRKLADSGAVPDCVIFSGDVVLAAGKPSDYDRAQELVSEILEIFRLPETCAIFCPGNHDVDRKYVADNIGNLERFRKAARSQKDLNTLVKQPQFQEYVNNAFAGYQLFNNHFNRGIRSFIENDVELYLFPTAKLGIVSINTAQLSGAGIENYHDDKALAVAEHPLRHALNGVPQGYAIVATGHHPLEWLTEANRALVESILSNRATAYLHGHMHDVQPRLIAGLNGECFYAQSGALYTDRSYYNGYSLISISGSADSSRVQLRSYYPKREEFDLATDQINGGIYYASDTAKDVWKSREEKASLGAWAQTTFCEQLETEFNDSLSDRSLSSVFVEPEFEREITTLPTGPIRLGSEREVLKFEQLRSMSENFIIAAPAESGKTSLLRLWAIRQAREVAAGAAMQIPVVTRASAIPGYKAKYQAFLNKSVAALPFGLTAKALADQGRVVFLIDDIDLHNGEQLKNIVRFIGIYPTCRFIFTTPSQLLSSAALEPVIGDAVEFKLVHLTPLKTGQLRELIQRHGVTSEETANRMISNMYDEMKNLSVPITPVTSTFLIQIYQQGDFGGFLNKANLIERFLEILLDKFGQSDLVPGSFDFRNKTHLLGYIAQKMVESSCYEPDESNVLTWIKEYLTDFGFPYSSRSLLDYFLSARVLKREEDKICFKLKAFFEYHCALRMADDDSFRTRILREENYLQFINEISFYAALVRDDGKLLELIFDRYNVNFNLRDDFEGLPNVKAARLTDIKLPKAEASEAEIFAVENQVFDRELTPNERDAFLDQERQPSIDDDQAVVRNNITTGSARSLGHLILLSSVLKHTELVSDASKREITKTLLDGWNEFTLLSLALVPTMSKTKRYWFGGLEYRLNFAEGLEVDEIARRLFLTMPIAVAKVAYMNLGTEKLLVQINEGIGNSEEPLERQLMRFCILADIGLGGVGDAAEQTMSSLQDNRYLSNVLMIKLYDSLLKLRVPVLERPKVRAVAADIVVHLSGARGRIAGDKKGKAINTIRRHELAIEFRAKALDQE